MTLEKKTIIELIFTSTLTIFSKDHLVLTEMTLIEMTYLISQDAFAFAADVSGGNVKNAVIFMTIIKSISRRKITRVLAYLWRLFEG